MNLGRRERRASHAADAAGWRASAVARTQRDAGELQKGQKSENPSAATVMPEVLAYFLPPGGGSNLLSTERAASIERKRATLSELHRPAARSER